jgi:pimeloyl-ACP methyl ester carboxylesterase
VYTPTLTGLGERSHLLDRTVDLTLHIADVVNVLRYEDLREVILVGHSYGGMVVTGVADRAPDRVGRLVYLDAACPLNGQSLVDVGGPHLQAVRAAGRLVDGVEVIVAPDLDLIRNFGVTDPDDMAWMQERLSWQPWKCFEEPLKLENQEAFQAVPQYQIIATSPLPVRNPAAIDEARLAGRLWEIDGGHDLMIIRPDAVAAALSEVAAS